MLIKTTLENVLKNHKAEYDEIVHKLRTSKSKYKNVNPDIEFTWAYSWCTEISGGSVKSLTDLAKMSSKKPTLIYHCFIKGTIKSRTVFFSKELASIPKIVKDTIDKNKKEAEEKNKKPLTKKDFECLSKSPRFVAFIKTS